MGESDPIRYRDFSIRIGAPARPEEPYPVIVQAPAGDAKGVMTLTVPREELHTLLGVLERARRGTRDFRREPAAAPVETARVEELGRTLFAALFTEPIRACYDESQAVLAEGEGLRLRLRIDAPELARFPWEILYDEREGRFISLSRTTPIVREVDLPRRARDPAAGASLALTPPLRILGMVATPEGLDDLDVAREQRAIERALADLVRDGLAELHWLPGESWRDLHDALQDPTWTIFHYIGHGGHDETGGFLELTNHETGQAERLTAHELALMLEAHPRLNLVVLNSCSGGVAGAAGAFPGTAAQLVRRGVRAVVAMQDAISDEAATAFARTFYQAVARGWPVDAAVASARLAVSKSVRDSVEWATPAIYLRALPPPVGLTRRRLRRAAAHPITIAGLLFAVIVAGVAGWFAAREQAPAFRIIDPVCLNDDDRASRPTLSETQPAVFGWRDWHGGLRAAHHAESGAPAYGLEWDAIYPEGSQCNQAQLEFILPSDPARSATLTICGLQQPGGASRPPRIEVLLNGDSVYDGIAPWQTSRVARDASWEEYFVYDAWSPQSFRLPRGHFVEGINILTIHNLEEEFSAEPTRTPSGVEIGPPWILLAGTVLDFSLTSSLGQQACQESPGRDEVSRAASGE